MVVTLFTGTGSLMKSDTTDINGKYQFEDLPAGQYYVLFGKPTGFDYTIPDAGADNVDSDVTGSQGPGTTAKFNVGIGVDQLNIDAGLTRCEVIGDYVWYDSNVNGIQESFERGVNGATVELYNAQGRLVATTVTKRNAATKIEGWYTLCVNPGFYYIKFNRPASIAHTIPNAGSDRNKDSDITNANGLYTTSIFQLISGQPRNDIDAGFVPDACVGNLVWFDDNYNGLQDSNEPNADKVTVLAIRQDGTIYDKVISDKDGYYHVDGLPPGKFYFKFQPPVKYGFTRRLLNGNKELDSDVSGAFGYGTTSLFDTEAGIVDNGVDAGILRFVLALDHLELNGLYADNQVKLAWDAESDVPVNEYILERMNRSEIGFVPMYSVKDIPAGSRHQFDWKDEKLPKGKSLFYRIKQVLENGEVNTSQIIEIKTNNDISNIEIKPNPVSDQLNVEITLPFNQYCSLTIVNADGKELNGLMENSLIQKGWTQLSYDISQLPSGTYWLKLQEESNATVIKFIKM
jgi:hypothetical protein